MRAEQTKKITEEKAAAGWVGGCNSVRDPWLLSDNQYIWGVNVVNRGGIIQTRYGYKQHLTLPDGNLQGYEIVKFNKSTATVTGKAFVFVVSGYVYYSQYPLTQIKESDWDDYKVPNIRLNPNASQVYFEVAEKSLNQTAQENLTRVPSYNVLIIQDGTSKAAYWDGELSGHLDGTDEGKQTPTGTWMKWAGQRLWVASGNTLYPGDFADPLSFTERLSGVGRGDFKFSDDITGLAVYLAENNQSNLLVFTENETSTIQSAILDREQWDSTAGFQSIYYPDLGCVSGRSIVSHAGLLWWYSNYGLVSSDSSASAFLSRQVKSWDIEMARSKVNLSGNKSKICAASFESYLMVSVPYGDELNAHTMVMDFSIADELQETSKPAWNGVWTGIRPIQWKADTYEGIRRMFCVSTDYQAIDGETSKNHLWEAFKKDRYDSYYQLNSQGEYELKRNRIYCSFESKMLGDGLDLKVFKYAEIDAIEIGDNVDLKISYFGNRGIYNEIQTKSIEATLDPSRYDNSTLDALYEQEQVFRPQVRRIRTQEERPRTELSDDVQSPYMTCVDKCFGLLFQWCGRMAIEAFRIYMDSYPEKPTGSKEVDETGPRIFLMDGKQYKL